MNSLLYPPVLLFHPGIPFFILQYYFSNQVFPSISSSISILSRYYLCILQFFCLSMNSLLNPPEFLCYLGIPIFILQHFFSIYVFPSLYSSISFLSRYSLLYTPVSLFYPGIFFFILQYFLSCKVYPSLSLRMIGLYTSVLLF